MKPSLSRLAGLSAVLAIATGNAFAHIDYSEAGTLHWIEHTASTPSVPDARALAPYGYETGGAADRVVVFDPAMKAINVTRMETVEFRLGNTSTTWTFDTLGTPSFTLAEAIPDATGITVYVHENPSYLY